MIRLNNIRFTQRSLGQSLDPVTHTALVSAGAILAQTGDAGAPETAQLVEQIMLSPGVAYLKGKAPGGGVTSAKISDVNPFLRATAGILDHPIITVAALIGIPAMLFLLGRKSANVRADHGE